LQLRLFQTMGEIAVNQNSTIILPIPLDLFRPFWSPRTALTGRGSRRRGARRRKRPSGRPSSCTRRP
jgi:hypothetical protein